MAVLKSREYRETDTEARLIRCSHIAVCVKQPSSKVPKGGVKEKKRSAASSAINRRTMSGHSQAWTLVSRVTLQVRAPVRNSTPLSPSKVYLIPQARKCLPSPRLRATEASNRDKKWPLRSRIRGRRPSSTLRNVVVSLLSNEKTSV